jgi:hypothetical protein
MFSLQRTRRRISMMVKAALSLTPRQSLVWHDLQAVAFTMLLRFAR